MIGRHEGLVATVKIYIHLERSRNSELWRHMSGTK